MFVRKKEHTKPTNSAVFLHKKQCKICQDNYNIFKFFQLLKFCKNRNILLEVEVIMIKN